MSTLSRSDWAKAALVVLIWGINFVIMKWGLETVSPFLLCALRFAAASVPLMLFVRRPRNLSWGILAAYGLAQGMGQFSLLFTAIRVGMPAGMASVVLQSQAFITLLLAALWLHERPQRWQWLGLGVATLGLMAIGSAHGASAQDMTLAGFFCTVGAAAMWSVSNLITRHAARHGPYEPLPFIVWSSVFPVLPLLGMAWWLEGGAQGMSSQLLALGWRELGVVFYLAGLSTLLGYSLWTQLLQRYPASTVAPLSLFVPVVGLLAAMTVLGERPMSLQWLGTLGVLAGMAVNQFAGRRALVRR